MPERAPRIPQQRRSREKRDAILAAAAALFAERGYDAVTTGEVAQAAGVAVGTLYQYFADKGQLLESLAAGAVEALDELDVAGMELDDPRGALRDLLARLLPYDARRFGLLRAWTTRADRRRDAGGRGAEIDRRTHAQLLAWTRRAQARGLTWPDLDAEATCWVVTRMLDHVWHAELDPRALPEAEFVRQREALADLVFRAIFRGAT